MIRTNEGERMKHVSDLLAELINRVGLTLTDDQYQEALRILESNEDHEYEHNVDSVGHFHERFNLDNTTHHDPGPRVVSDELMNFRVKFMEEELQEFKNARAKGDIAEMADALIDLSYVTLGTAHVMGLPWNELFLAVQTANMAKERALRPEQSLRGSTYDVVKPAGWQPPDINAVLRRHGWKV